MKLLATISFTLCFLFASAQIEEYRIDLNQDVLYRELKVKAVEKTPFRDYGSTWFNLHNDLVGQFLLDGSLAASPLQGLLLFPDSTIIIGVSSTSGKGVPAWIYSAAEVINPSITPSNWIDPYGKVVVDSIMMYYSYLRNTDPGIVDTVFVEVIKHEGLSWFSGNGDANNDLGEFAHQRLVFDSAENGLPMTQKMRTDTILLTEADSSAFVDYLFLNVNDTIEPSSRYGINVKFKPGYTWAANVDTITDYNEFYIVSREQADGQYPNQLWDVNSGFMSYLTTMWSKYDASNSFYKYLIPTAVYSDPFAYEHHMFFYKLTSNELTVEEVSSNLGSLNVFPNPITSSVASVQFELKKEGKVVASVYDMTGKLIMLNDFGFLREGIYTEVLDVNNLKTGQYILNVNGSIRNLTIVK